jgi:protein-tyrosine phosphatase
VKAAGLASQIECDSAGTAAYHTGSSPDARSTAAASRRGIRLSGAARQFVATDFARFDYVLAMDTANLQALEELAGPHPAKPQLLRDYDPGAGSGASVPDPYYGGEAGFEEVLDQCERACAAFLAHVRQVYSLT